MLGFLNGVPGKLKTLTDRVTSTWAAKLDTLHDTRITSTRAGYLDKLNITGNVAGSSELSSGLAALSIINSIQTGYAFSGVSTGSGEDAEYIDVTISTVDTSKSIVLIQSVNLQNTNNPVGCTARLTSSTNLRISNRNAADNPGGRWTVVEFK